MKRSHATLCLFLAVGLWSPAPAGLADEPAAVVERVDDALLAAMREAETLGYQGRYDLLAPVLSQSFHFGSMARVTAGRHWRGLDTEQKRRFVDAFERMSIATHAARFDGYSGQSFEVGESVSHARGTVLVRNRLTKPEGETVSIDYLLREIEGRWRIIDVFLEGGISEIAMKRSEYGSVLKRDGIEGLLARLAQKTAELAAEGKD